MSDQDQLLARRVLEKGRLSRVQAEALLEEAARTGRSFRDLAVGRGLLSAQDFQAPRPRQVPLPVVILLGVGLTILALVLVVSSLERAGSKVPAVRPVPAAPQGSK
jgi:hypothetical protein